MVEGSWGITAVACNSKIEVQQSQMLCKFEADYFRLIKSLPRKVSDCLTLFRNRTMKHLIFAACSLALSAVAFVPAAKAQQMQPYQGYPQNTQPYQSQSQDYDGQGYQNRMSTREMTPFNLSSLAYRGYFEEQGIPSYGNLSIALKTGSTTPDDVIQAAVDSGRISATEAEDSSFRTAVNRQLFALRILGQ